MVEFWGGPSSWLADSRLLAVSSHDRGKRDRATLMTSSKSDYLPKTLPPNTIPSKGSVSIYDLGGTQTCMQSTTWLL